MHHCMPAREWLGNHRGMIDGLYLLAYSPELNLNEFLNCDLKKGIPSGRPERNKKAIKV